MTLTRRTPLKRGAPLKRTPLKATPMKRKSPPVGFTKETKDAIRRRAGSLCEAKVSPACWGRGAHCHHIRRRETGDHRPENGLFVCPPCHTHIHEHPAESVEKGFIIRVNDAG